MPLHPVLPSRAAARRASCLTCTARAHTVCAAVPEAEIDRVALIKLPPRRLAAGAAIYAEQDHCVECFTVLEGWVALTAALENGGRVVLDFALPGDHFGFPADPDAPRGQSATAVTEVRLCPLPRASMQRLLGVDAALAKHLAHLVALHEARSSEHLINIASRDAHGRIAHLLVELYFRQTHRLPHGRGETIALPLTLALIGEAVALTTEHVSRTLRRLREEGVIRLCRGRLLICDPDALIRASGVADRPLADAATPMPPGMPRPG
jgi:CRP-like cAMP-binding protein